MKIYLHGQNPATMLLALLLQNESRHAAIDLKLFKHDAECPTLNTGDFCPNFPSASNHWRQSAEIWLNAERALPFGGVIPCRVVGAGDQGLGMTPSLAPAPLNRSLARLCALRNIRVVSTIRASNFILHAGDVSVEVTEQHTGRAEAIHLKADIPDGAPGGEVGIELTSKLPAPLRYARIGSHVFLNTSELVTNEYSGVMLWRLAEEHFPTFPRNLSRITQFIEPSDLPLNFTIDLESNKASNRVVIRASAAAQYVLAPSIALSAWALIRNACPQCFIGSPPPNMFPAMDLPLSEVGSDLKDMDLEYRWHRPTHPLHVMR